MNPNLPLHSRSLKMNWKWVQNLGNNACFASCVLVCIRYLNAQLKREDRFKITRKMRRELRRTKNFPVLSSGVNERKTLRIMEGFSDFLKFETDSLKSVKDLHILMLLKTINPIIVVWDTSYGQIGLESTSHANIVYNTDFEREIIYLIDTRSTFDPPIVPVIMETFTRGWQRTENLTYILYSKVDPPLKVVDKRFAKNSIQNLPNFFKSENIKK
ncbi:hypothetical protein CEE45_05200 [Candidatus Heimdallarchaeota archaeon B3_Heim]|nr:MAG: hypothetical protein CEE45_05200 [Candidatus Heimdallarchaeota archaeon B3_Heim]